MPRVIPAASTANSPSRTAVDSIPEPFWEKNSDNRITVAKSATDALAITSCPNPVPVSPASFSTATTIPNEVAARSMPTNSGASARRAARSTSPAAMASRSETKNASPTIRRWRSLWRSKAISSPARKNRNTSPIWESTVTGSSTWASPRTVEPIRMPATSSITTGGTLGSGSRSNASGAAVGAGTATGRETHFLVLISFIVSWGFIRTSAHMIHAQVSWWPGNVKTKGGTHIHHLVWGILLLLIFGYVGIALDPGSPLRQIVAIMFGVGMGLTLDEFALWLNLQDVGGEHLSVKESALALIPAQAIGAVCALVAFAKGKLFTAVVGLFVPLVAVIGAIRLAKPGSRWARRYSGSKLERSRARFGERHAVAVQSGGAER